MPVLNEEKYLEAAVESIFQQTDLDLAHSEVILALGPSTDKTLEVAQSLAKRFPVKIVDNPTGKTPAGLNSAIKAAKYEVVVRVDAHSQLSPDYTKLAVQILNETKAANVGGLMKAVGDNPLQKAVSWGYGSRFGLGGGTFHVGGQAGPSDSVYLGVFRKDILNKLGGFNEKMLRGQDWELNLRIREAGEVVWFDPRLQVTYKPRSSLKALAKQFFDTGIWRAELTKTHLNKANLRYFAPPALVLSTLLGLLAVIFNLGGVLGLIPISIYMAAVVLAAIFNKEAITTKIGILLALPTMHFSWGLGFLTGLFKKAGN
jgi:glycosyltransferase involved in cell wall biosynthesis